MAEHLLYEAKFSNSFGLQSKDMTYFMENVTYRWVMVECLLYVMQS